jgi:hypothetical protein
LQNTTRLLNSVVDYILLAAEINYIKNSKFSVSNTDWKGVERDF